MLLIMEQEDATENSWLKPSVDPNQEASASRQEPQQGESVWRTPRGRRGGVHERPAGEFEAKVREQGSVEVLTGSLHRIPMCFMKVLTF